MRRLFRGDHGTNRSCCFVSCFGVTVRVSAGRMAPGAVDAFDHIMHDIPRNISIWPVSGERVLGQQYGKYYACIENFTA
jgi:hypothetical protein